MKRDSQQPLEVWTGTRASELPPASVRRCVSLPIRLPDGRTVAADAFTFDGLLDAREHLAIGLGDYKRVAVPLVRPHSQCLTGDVFGSARCDCGRQLEEAIDRICEVGGYVVYLRQEGRGIGLYNKLDAYALQEGGADTFEANRSLGFKDDERTYSVVCQMLRALGVDRIDLLTNSPDKVSQLRYSGVFVRRVRRTGLFATDENSAYLHAKASLAGHVLWPEDCSAPVVSARAPANVRRQSSAESARSG